MVATGEKYDREVRVERGNFGPSHIIPCTDIPLPPVSSTGERVRCRPCLSRRLDLGFVGW